MEFGENDVYIAMEEGDLDGEELDDLDDADPVGTHRPRHQCASYHHTLTTQWWRRKRT